MRHHASVALARAGGLCLVIAGVMVVVPALAPGAAEVVVSDATAGSPSTGGTVGGPGAATAARTVTAAPAAASTASAASSPLEVGGAMALLTRAAQAVRSRAWSGTQQLSVFGSMPSTAVVDVRHEPGVGSWMSVRATTGSSPGTRELFEPETVDAPDGQPADWLSLVGSHYAVARDGNREVGDVTTEVLRLTRSDSTTAALIFVDGGSGFVVGRELYDLQGDLMRSSTFTSLTEHPADAQALPAQATRASAIADRSLGQVALAAWRAAGWSIPATAHEDFDLVDARAAGSGPGDQQAVLHLTYSDGLSSVSVFAERGRLDTSVLRGWSTTRRASWPVAAHGGVHDQLAWSDGTRVWTIVADAPAEVVDSIVAALPHRHVQADYSHRFTRGLRRLGGWLNPLP